MMVAVENRLSNVFFCVLCFAVDDHHLANSSFWYRMFYLMLSVEFAKSKYFFGWTWGKLISLKAPLH